MRENAVNEVRTTVSEERGLVATVPTEVYLAYEDRAKEIAARAVTETPAAIKNAILRFVLEARLSAALDHGVRPKLTAYELQVLIGTTTSGCNMSPDQTFDLPAAWKRLRSLDLIDRADGLAIATQSGVELVAALLTELQHRREAEAGLPADTSIDHHAYRVAHIDPKLVRYVEMLRHECAYEGPCSDNGDGCSCSAEELNERHMRTLAASPSSPASGVRVKAGIYVASKVAHAEMWRDLREFEKMPIISTWIDEAGPGESADLNDLWRRCIEEASNAAALLILRRPDEVLKGAWIELGAALASGVPVYAVGIEEFTVAKDKRIRHFPNLVEARAAIRSALGGHT